MTTDETYNGYISLIDMANTDIDEGTFYYIFKNRRILPGCMLVIYNIHFCIENEYDIELILDLKDAWDRIVKDWKLKAKDKLNAFNIFV